MLRSLIRTAAIVGLHQARNLKALLDGEPVTVTQLESGTLEEDDLEIVRDQLKNRATWRDDSIVNAFNAGFARWNGSSCAFAFMSGREAMSACLAAIGLKAGDEVLVPGYTCIVVPNALTFAGIHPIYCDIELDTYGLDAARLESRITARTKAVIVHHLYGLVCRDYDDLLRIARRRNIAVIEDCTQATGASYHGRPIGNQADFAVYSSEHSKIFNTVRGGVAVTNSPDLATRIEKLYWAAPVPDDVTIENQLCTALLFYYSLRHPERWWMRDVAELRYGRKRVPLISSEERHRTRPASYGQRMASPIAALGCNQLRKVDVWNQRRREAARGWDGWAAASGYKTPMVISGSTPVFLRYPIQVEPDRKSNTSWARKELGVELGLWFRTQLHPVPGVVDGCPNAEIAVATCVNLPCILDAGYTIPAVRKQREAGDAEAPAALTAPGAPK